MDKHFDTDMKVVVINDGKKVFKGLATEFLSANEGDEDVLDMLNTASVEGKAYGYFYSGEWVVERRSEV